MSIARRLLILFLLVAAVGLLAACGDAAPEDAGEGNVIETPPTEPEATEPVEVMPTEMVHPTETAAPEPTEEPESTATSEPEPEDTEEPEATEEPGETAGANSLEVADQELGEGGTVNVPLVNSAGDGWMVIHADANGGPGPVIGFTPVAAGENISVSVPIDVAGATETLHAMLHIDEGTAGAYEFPGADAPARDDADAVVMLPFALSGLPADAVSVAGQLVNEANSVVVPAVRAAADGWMVIHTDQNGGPGPVAGFAPLTAGNNYNVVVELDATMVTTGTLHAMLHVDAGAAGEYEFPGADGPVMDADGNVVMLPFQVVEQVSALDSEFAPRVLRVVAGTTVTWSNDGQFPHTVDADSGLFSSGDMASGDTYEFTFENPGTYAYYCALHGGPGGVGMAGTVIVVPGE